MIPFTFGICLQMTSACYVLFSKLLFLEWLSLLLTSSFFSRTTPVLFENFKDFECPLNILETNLVIPARNQHVAVYSAGLV